MVQTSPSKTYADWVAHITARATGGAVAWGGEMTAQGIYRTTAAAATGGMAGSPWMAVFRRASSAMCRIVQHALPSEAVFNAQIASGRQVILQSVDDAATVTVPLDRNGFLSGDASVITTYTCPLIGWWDDATQSALMNNPQAGTGPVPYVASGW